MLNDFNTGIFGALGAYAALIRRAKEGGSYHVKVSLCRCSTWYGTLGFFERGDTKRDGEQHKLIEPDMFEAETPLGFLRRPAPCVEFSETKGYWADPVLHYRGSDKPEWRSRLKSRVLASSSIYFQRAPRLTERSPNRLQRLPSLPVIPQLRLLCRSETSTKSLTDHQTPHLLRLR